MQTHLSMHPVQRLGQEMRSPHPVHERTEGVLYRLPSNSHRLRRAIKPLLHGLKNSFMLPASNAPVLTGCAFLFDGAARAVRAPVFMDAHSPFFGREPPNQAAAGRTLVLT